ncbi:MAG TPA: GNAT family N-acetyltransferase [Blastocatellia bacterium]|nr:GNAT family N-acetyltransferase [Blastocatellia bacterium]
MSSLILDNGLENPLNRGTFYGCRDIDGQLRGVALIGHALLISAWSRSALKAFAFLARGYTSAHVLMDSPERLAQFWHYYSTAGQPPRLLCRELCFEQRRQVRPALPVAGLRLATAGDLDLVIPVQAQMAEAESGVNPLTDDPSGFRDRCLRRIECGRMWVWVEQGRLIFKADLQAETPGVGYLEGVWVSPQERNRHYGLHCLQQLTCELLRSRHTIYLLVNEQNQNAQAFYRRAGYRQCGSYETIFLRPGRPNAAGHALEK